MSGPTQQDVENAARRKAIADRFKAEYDLAHDLAASVLGPG